MTLYSRFLSGALPLETPCFTTVAENVSRFLVSNGVVAEGASREQVQEALGEAPSLFERIRRPDEALPETVLRLQSSFKGVIANDRAYKVREKLSVFAFYSGLPEIQWWWRDFRFQVDQILFDGGIRVFDDHRERAAAIVDEIDASLKTPARVNNRLREISYKIARSHLGEHEADTWLALIAAMDKAPPRKMSSKSFEGITKQIAQAPLGLRAPDVLRALCAHIDRTKAAGGFRSAYLTDTAIAANRLGWPEIAETLLEELRSQGGGSYYVFNTIIEELGIRTG